MKEYFLTKRFKLIYAGLDVLPRILVTCLIIGFWIYLFRSTDISQAVCVIFPMFAIFFLGLIVVVFFIIRQIRDQHLTISEDSIQYHYMWRTFEAKWSDIKKISKRWHNSWYIECLLVNTADVHVESMFPVWKIPFGTTSIPLSCFAENWRDSELGRQIKQYAPQLFSPVEN